MPQRCHDDAVFNGLRQMSISRRQFLAAGAGLSFLGLGATPALATAPAQKLLVLVYLKGGNDAYNTFVPTADAKYYKLRPTLAIASDQTITINDRLGVNSALQPLMSAWASRDLAIVQGIGQQEITNQHYRDLEMQFTAAGPEQYYTEGWVTRALLKNPLRGSTRISTLDALAFGDLDIRVSDPMGPFRGELLRAVQVQQMADWFATSHLSLTPHLATIPAKTSAANFLRPESTALKAVFPQDEFSQALRATVELAAAGLAPPVVHITINADDADQHHAFDTHWRQRDYHSAALSRLAGGLSAFRAGMLEIGAWDNTLLATYDEFGRSPKENENHGTHHGWSSTHLVAGGRVKGGLYGKAPPAMDVYALDGPPPVIDYRELYTTVIESWWGGRADGVFDRRFKPLDLLRS